VAKQKKTIKGVQLPLPLENCDLCQQLRIWTHPETGAPIRSCGLGINLARLPEGRRLARDLGSLPTGVCPLGLGSGDEEPI
jgi:hypothetical protein